MPGTFTYSPGIGTKLNAGANQSLSTNFMPDDTGNFNPAVAIVHINVLGGAHLAVSTTITNTDPCIGTGSILTVNSKVTHSNGLSPQLDNPGPEFVAQIPSQVSAVAGSCTATSGACVINGSQIEWNGAVGVGQTVTISYKLKVKELATPGASLCIIAQAYFDSDADGMNESTASSTECALADCGFTPCTGPDCPQPGPGELSPSGSVLVYNFYSSHAVNPVEENTRITITNTETARTAYVHLFFVDGSSCSVADAFICLTPNQTASFLASDVDPGVSGYLVAVAVDQETGCPINFNFLIGEEYVKLPSGHAANLKAEAFQAFYDGALPGCDTSSNTAVLAFDGTSYSLAPRTLALSYVASPADGNSTMLILNSFGGNLATSASQMGDIFGVLYDDAETPFSFTFSGGCQLRQTLTSSFPRTTPRFSVIIPSGRGGWMKFSTAEDAALLGAAINFNPNAAALPSAFNQGHNLHHLSLTTAARLTIPIIPPSC
jgi:hypothetical protein